MNYTYHLHFKDEDNRSISLTFSQNNDIFSVCEKILLFMQMQGYAQSTIKDGMEEALSIFNINEKEEEESQ